MNSTYEIRQAKMSKRICAFFVDLFIFVIIFSLSMLICNSFMDYKDSKAIYDEKCLEYNLVVEKVNEEGETYAASWTIYDFLLSDFASAGCKVEKEEDIKEISEECQKEFNDFLTKQNEEFGKDKVALDAYESVVNYRVSFFVISSFLPLLLINFVFPLIFKNGQTLGKKLFKLGLVNKDGVRARTTNIITRFLIGIFAFEVLPLMIYLAVSNVYTICLLIGLAVTFVNFILFIFTNSHKMIHDVVGGTIVVDLHTTIIFDSIEEKNRIKGNAK